MSIVHTRPLQLYLPLPLLLVALHFIDDTPGSDVVQLGGVPLVDILIIETLHVVLVSLLLVGVVGSPQSGSAPEINHLLQSITLTLFPHLKTGSTNTR